MKEKIKKNTQNVALISAQYIIQTTSAMLQAQKKDELEDIFWIKEMDENQKRQYYLEFLAFILSNAIFGKKEILKEETPKYIGFLLDITTSLLAGDEYVKAAFAQYGSFILEKELGGLNFDKKDLLGFIQKRVMDYADIARSSSEESRMERVVAAAIINMDILKKADHEKANAAMLGVADGLVKITNKMVTNS